MDAIKLTNNKILIPYLGGYGIKYLVNGKETKLKKLIINESDSLHSIELGKVLSHYENDSGHRMSIEEFESKPTYYDNETPDEEVLRRIANKKEVEGFKPVGFDRDTKIVELNIIGYMEDTGSLFIHSVPR